MNNHHKQCVSDLTSFNVGNQDQRITGNKTTKKAQQQQKIPNTHRQKPPMFSRQKSISIKI